MMYGPYTPYKGGVLTVQLASEVAIPDTVEFLFTDKTVSVDFWLVQVIRQSIDMNTSTYSDDFENKIGFIKGIRKAYSLGLKESKDIVEWFCANVNRGVNGKL